MNCLTCSFPLMPGSRRRYCSDACRMVAYRLRRSRSRKAALSSLFSALRVVCPPELRDSLCERVKALVAAL